MRARVRLETAANQCMTDGRVAEKPVRRAHPARGYRRPPRPRVTPFGNRVGRKNRTKFRQECASRRAWDCRARKRGQPMTANPLKFLAERVGFEPTREFPPYTLSRGAPSANSATSPRLRPPAEERGTYVSWAVASILGGYLRPCPGLSWLERKMTRTGAMVRPKDLRTWPSK